MQNYNQDAQGGHGGAPADTPKRGVIPVDDDSPPVKSAATILAQAMEKAEQDSVRTLKESDEFYNKSVELISEAQRLKNDAREIYKKAERNRSDRLSLLETEQRIKAKSDEELEEREKLKPMINDIATKIDDIDDQIARLTNERAALQKKLEVQQHRTFEIDVGRIAANEEMTQIQKDADNLESTALRLCVTADKMQQKAVEKLREAEALQAKSAARASKSTEYKQLHRELQQKMEIVGDGAAGPRQRKRVLADNSSDEEEDAKQADNPEKRIKRAADMSSESSMSNSDIDESPMNADGAGGGAGDSGGCAGSSGDGAGDSGTLPWQRPNSVLARHKRC